jgi:ribosomal protein L22
MADDPKQDEVEETPEVEETAVAEAETPEAEAPEAETPEAETPEAEAAEDAPVEETAAEEPVAEEKPKPKRAPRKKAAEPEAEEPPAPAPKAERAKREAVTTPPVVRAQAKYVRTSARKARLVCDNIRGKSVDEARAILAFTPRAVAKDWAKLLNSAVANAEHNHELLGDDLKVAAAYADEGPTLKRFQPRAMGRATRIRKRTAHLTITLTPKE